MRTTQHLSQLVIRDLAQISGLTFAHPDRLTRAEAEAVRSWAQTQPVILQALRRGGEDAEAVRLFQGVVDHFASDHGQTAAGDPAPWKGGRLLDDGAPIESMTADEASARLAWARTKPEYKTSYLDKSDPQHALLVEQTMKLMERANQVAPVAPSIGEPDKPSDDAQARIATARSDPAFQDRTSPHHKAAVQAVADAYAAAFPEPGNAAAPADARAAVPSFQEATRAIQEHEAYLDRGHALHGAKVAEMSALYEAHYAEPTPEGGQS